MENLNCATFDVSSTRAEPTSLGELETITEDVRSGVLPASSRPTREHEFVAKSPERGGTNISASFEETAVWDQKSVLSLGVFFLFFFF